MLEPSDADVVHMFIGTAPRLPASMLEDLRTYIEAVLNLRTVRIGLALSNAFDEKDDDPEC